MRIARPAVRLAYLEALEGPSVWVTAFTAVALAARLFQLAGPVLRWDEGWSLAHASLPWTQLWQVAREEWHPPLYVALLKLWLLAGKSTWSIRFLSVLLGTLAVPLTYKVAWAWSERPLTAILAAGLSALWPLLVYYGQVTRMYALSAFTVLAAAWFMLRSEEGAPWWNDLGLVLSAAASLYTLYHTAWVLAGLWIYAAVLRPRRIPRLFLLGLGAVAGYLPWLLAASLTLEQRLGAAPSAGGSSLLGALRFLVPTVEGLAFVEGAGHPALAALAIVFAAGFLAARPVWADTRKLLLPFLVLGASVAGVAYASQDYWFAPRHLVPATPFLGLALAWALDRLARRGRPLVALALVGLAVVYWPASSRFVYQKTLEVTAPFDPAADYRYLQQHVAPGDLIYFNTLAEAGWYENLRGPRDPAWSYCLRWDPIVEPLDRIAQRVTGDSRTHHRLWFVLHEGSYGPNGELVVWLNENLYPAGGEWQGKKLYLAYAAPSGAWQSAARDDRFEPGIRLVSASWLPEARAGDVGALSLVWATDHPVPGAYKVFVHAVDDSGRLVAQHDQVPAAGARPTNSWAAGDRVVDRHGLLLPAAADLGAPSQLHIRVGLYDPQTGQRLRLLDGRDAIDLCTITLR